MGEKLITMLHHGKEIPYQPDIENTTVHKTDMLEKPLANCGGPDAKPYRAALFIRGGAIDPDMSVTDAIQGGVYDENTAEGITVLSSSDDFSALLLLGKNYAIRNSTFRFITESRGEHVNDFNGYGCVIGVYTGARLTMENCYLESAGVAKPTVYCYHQSDVLMKNCFSRAMGGKLYEGYVNSANPSKMVAPPWVLGITGNARSTNLTGEKSTMTVVNCLMTANQWGVMSTDMGADMQLTAIDSDLMLLGDSPVPSDAMDPYSTRYGSGYGTYAIGNAVENFYGVHFKVGTYATILTGGYCTYRSSRGTIQVNSPYDGHLIYEGAGTGRITEIDSDAFGFMAHGTGTLTVTDDTVVRSKCSTFLLKSSGVTINVENGAKLIPGNGIILQMIDNDDTLVGAAFENGSFAFHTEFFEPEGWPSENGSISSRMEKKPPEEMRGGPEDGFDSHGDPSDAPPMAAPPAENKDPLVRFNAARVTLQGDLFNGTGYYGEEAKQLIVTLGAGAILDGAISATETIHVDGSGKHNTHFTSAQFYDLGHVDNRPFYSGDNFVAVELKDGAVWNVTENCIVNNLLIGTDCVLNGSIAVNGIPMNLEYGILYSGIIELKPAG